MLTKIFKYILVLSIAIGHPYTSDAQILSKIFRKGAKETSQVVTKKAVQKTSREISEEIVKKSFRKNGAEWAKSASEVIDNYNSIKILKNSGEEALQISMHAGIKAISKEGAEKLLLEGATSQAQRKVISAVQAVGDAEMIFRNNLKKASIEISQSSPASKIVRKQFMDISNEKLVQMFALKMGLDEKMQKKLISEMADNPGLAALIKTDPEFNIGRWKIARRPVDKSKLTKVNGRNPVNAEFAGKNFYFEPELNRKLKSRLKTDGKYDYYNADDLKRLDAKYPHGIPYRPDGTPDFVSAKACKLGPDGKPISYYPKGGKFSGDRDKDISEAQEYMKRKYGPGYNEHGYTWHHDDSDPARLILVDYDVHRICKHTGGHAKHSK